MLALEHAAKHLRHFIEVFVHWCVGKQCYGCQMLSQSSADMLTPVHLYQRQRVPVLSHKWAAENFHLAACYALHNSVPIEACMHSRHGMSQFPEGCRK